MWSRKKPEVSTAVIFTHSGPKREKDMPKREPSRKAVQEQPNLDRSAPPEKRAKNSAGQPVGTTLPQDDFEQFRQLYDELSKSGEQPIYGKVQWPVLVMDVMMLYMAVQAKNEQAVHMAIQMILSHLDWNPNPAFAERETNEPA